MLCSNCYKKIPEGEEIRKGSGLGPWGWIGGGSKVVCLKCAKDDKKKSDSLRNIHWFFSNLIFVVFIFSVFH